MGFASRSVRRRSESFAAAYVEGGDEEEGDDDGEIEEVLHRVSRTSSRQAPVQKAPNRRNGTRS